MIATGKAMGHNVKYPLTVNWAGRTFRQAEGEKRALALCWLMT
jgi:hypothetical protein